MTHRANSAVNLRSTVLAFYLSLVLSLVVVLSAVKMARDVMTEYQSYHDTYKRKMKLTHAAIDNYEWLKDHVQTFDRMEVDGIIGTPDNLVWVDFLAGLPKLVSLADYQYEIGPLLSNTNAKGVEIKTADITIYGNMAHDGVLGRLLEVITESAPGGWFYRSMVVTRDHQHGFAYSSPGNSIDGSGLKIVLRLTWVLVVMTEANEALA